MWNKHPPPICVMWWGKFGWEDGMWWCSVVWSGF